MPPMSREMVCMAIDLRKEEELGNMKITDISVLYVAVHHVRGLSIVHTDKWRSVQSVQGCAECCIESEYKNVNAREKMVEVHTQA